MEETRETATERHRIGYQPALDGLRGIAVLAVLAYHGGVTQAQGGFLGVDVFFVLSGFLITALLVQEWRQNGRIDIRAFWKRRIKRLMPALLLLSIAMVVWLFLIAEPDQRSSLRLDIFATLGYVANWRFISSGQSYFAQFADPSPLRHTWSLAVEEQWYLVWPLIVWAGLRITRGRLGRMSIGVLAAAVASSVWGAVLWGNGDLSRVYYGTDTRAQELLVGAALALVLAKVSIKKKLTFDLLGIMALAALITSMLFVHDSTPWLYQGGQLGIAIAVALVIVAGVQPGRGVIKAGLSILPLRALGKISYGLYLWHWPVNIVLTTEFTALDGWALFAVRVETSLVLALVSYFALERPIQRMVGFSHNRPRRHMPYWSFGITRAAAACGAMAVIAAMVVVLQSPSGQPTPGGLPGDAAIGATLSTMLASSPTETTKAPKPTPPEATPTNATPKPETEHLNALVAGDSVAFTLGFGFSPETVDPNLSIGVTAILGCGVVTGRPYVDGRPHPDDFKGCDKWEQTWRDGVTMSKPDVIVLLLGAWEVLDREVGGQILRAGTPEYTTYLEGQLTKAFDILTANGTPVVMLNTPCYRETEAKLGGPTSDRNDPVRGDWVNQTMRRVANRYGRLITSVDLDSYICPNGEPRERINDVKIRYDGVHFTSEGGAEIWRWLAPKVRDAVKTSYRPG